MAPRCSPARAACQLRVIEIEGAPWFVAKDVCQVLGIANTTTAVRPLSDDERGLEKIYTPGGAQPITVISESGLYKLVMRAHSSNPEAAKFQDWVTGTVLPAIRKDGGYLMGEENTRHPWTGIYHAPSEKGGDKGSHKG